MSLPGRPWLAGLGTGPRIVVVFALVFGFMGSLGLLLMKNSLLPTFDSMERNFALDSAKRVVSGFDEQMSTVSALNHDWAYWEQLHRHMQRLDSVFERSKIGQEGMQSSNLHAISLMNLQGQVRGFGARAFSNVHVAQVGDLARLQYALCVVCWILGWCC